MRRRNLILVLAALVLAVGVSLFIRQANQWGRPTADRTSAAAPTSGRTTTIVSAAGAPALLTGQSAAAPADPVEHQFRNTTNNIETLLANNRAILLENALIDTTRPLDFSIPEHLRAAVEPGTYLVQSRGFITERFQTALTTAGATVLSYIPNNAYQVAATAAVAEQLAGHPDVQAVLPFEPIYKLKSELLGWAVEQKALPEGAKLNLLLTPALQAAAREALVQAGATIVAETTSPFGPVVTVTPGADWAGLARLAGVQGVELARLRMQANDRSRVALGIATNAAIQTNYLGLTGSNVLVGLNDSGVSADHPDLINRIIPFTAGAGVDDNGHGTHIAGIIAGDGTQSLTVTNARGSVNPATTNQYRGMAPGAKILVQAIDLDGTGVSDEALQVNAASTNAFINNNSWHYAGAFSYDLAASRYDAAVRDALPGVTGSQPQLYVFASGNSGNGGDEGLGGFARSIASPGTAKNVITVGAVEQARDITNIVTKISGDQTNTSTPWAAMTSSDQQVAGFSGRGNVGVGFEGTYGRFKPDVVAPGTFVLSTRSTTWDEKAYYNPTSHIRSTERRLVATNAFDYPFGGVPLPLNAVAFSIRLVPNSNSPVPFPNLRIYVDKDDYPTALVYDFIGTNSFAVPPDGGGSVTGGETWFYGIRNVTTQAVDFTIITDIVVTNENGDQLTVLSNLNNSLSGGVAPHYYRYESGTSMSAGGVSGTLALMQEFFQSRGITNSPAMMKALLINGARSVDSSLYNFLVRNTINYQGWGLPKLPNSISASWATNTSFLTAPSNSIYMYDQAPTNALATGQSKTRFFTVSEDGRTLPLRVTLVWTDPPGNPAAGVKLVNDLDLVVTNLNDPANPIVYYGNNFPAGQFTAGVGTNSAPNPDLVNNVENVYINADLGSNYSVTVTARRVNVNAVTAHPNGIVQDYALVISSGGGEAGDALSLVTDSPIVGTNANFAAVTVITNIFVGDGFSSAGLEGQRVGANSPLLGTTTGTTNQWHFFVITNAPTGTNIFTNASFLISAATDLSIPRGGVNESSFLNATRVYADVDLYVAPNNQGLLSLDPAAVAGADKSLSRNTFNGDEAVIYSNSVVGDVYYIGVKSEDYQAAEFELWAIFSLLPLGQEDEDGFLRAYPVIPGEGHIPSGPNDLPGVAKWRAFAPGGGDIRRVVITNSLTHQRLDDVVSSVVSPGGTAVTLNNHKRLTTPAAPGPYEFLYEDNDEGDYLDAIHPDGPGHLYDYVGQKKSGQWKFFFVDNVLSATGRVDNLRVRLEEQCEEECNMTNTVAPQSWRYFSKNIPVEATNMTVCVNIITPTDPQPLELYIRKDQFPTRTAYDFRQTINPPGGCLSVDKFQLPPLSPGRYFIGVFNPSASSQDFYINITVETGPAPTPITFNPAGTQPLLDDAVTNFTTTVTDHMQIARLDVGLRIDHPRVSDLAVTLISPGGTRVLLAENRGGTSTSGFGSSLPVVTNFIPVSAAGGPAATNIFIDTGATAGTVTIDYNFFEVPDQMRVYYEGNLLRDTGMVDGTGRLRLDYGPGASPFIEVRMNEAGNTNLTTAWDFTASSYSTANSYLVFTDNTNLTTTPIKFALPPFTGTPGTSYELSNFELPTAAQDYIGPTVGTPDGWSVINSNTVTVITNTAYNGTNSLALRSGEMSRGIITTPGRTYRLGYAYQKAPSLDGIISWWRAEGNGLDSVGGNHGQLLVGAGYGAGMVGQGFSLNGNANSYLRVPDSVSLNLTNEFTVELWYKDTNPAAYSYGLMAKRGTSTIPCNYGINSVPTGIGPYFNDPSFAGVGDDVGPYEASRFLPTPSKNVFHHFAATFRQAGPAIVELNTFIDGVLVRTRTIPGVLANTLNNAPLVIGASSPAGEFFQGIIDEVTIFNRALSDSDVTAIYNAGAAGKCGAMFPPSICAPTLGAQIYVPGVTNSFLGTTNWQVGTLVFTATGANTTINVSPVSTNLPSGVLVDYFTVTETASPRYVLPEESLTAFEGEYADGEWRLEILDTRTGATNNVSLLDWQLQFVYQTNTAPPRVLDPGTPVDITLPPGRIIYFVVDVPSFARFATNVLYNATGPVGFYFNQNLPPGYGATNIGDVAFAPLPPGAQNLTRELSSNTVPQLISGQRYYLAVENSGTSNVNFTVYVDFDLRALPPVVDLTNGVPYCTVNPTPLSLDYYRFIVSSNAVRAQFSLSELNGDMTMILRRGLPPSFNSFDYLSASGSTNDEIITVFDFSQPVSLAPGDWYFAAANLSPGAVSYCATAWEWTSYGTNIVITNVFLGTNSFCLTWTSLPGVRYVVEGVTNLNSTNWVAVSPTVIGAGPVTTYCVPLPSPYQFFRVREGQAQSTFVPPPYIIRIVKRFNGIEIVWSGPPGQQYRVEWSPTLVPAVWTQFAETITSTTGIYGYLDDGSQTGGFGATRYYRLVLLP
jgi:subtilisin-like proprotein convertase family protein